jgi:hypothetical protein
MNVRLEALSGRMTLVGLRDPGLRSLRELALGWPVAAFQAGGGKGARATQP